MRESWKFDLAVYVLLWAAGGAIMLWDWWGLLAGPIMGGVVYAAGRIREIG